MAKISDCCGSPAREDGQEESSICGICHEHCDYVEEDEEPAELGAFDSNFGE
jgi:hypothetical protein